MIIDIPQGNIPSYTQVLEQYLNAMMMPWGSNNSAIQAAPSYGCTLTRKATSVGVWILLVIEIGFFLPTVTFGPPTSMMLRRNKELWGKIVDLPSDMIES